MHFMWGTNSLNDRSRFIRFLVSGGVNTLFGFAVYSVFILSGAAVWIALICGNILGALFNFFTTSGFVFRDISYSRAPRFLLCYALVYVINLQMLEWLSSFLSNKIAAQAVLVMPFAVFSFLLMKKIVFVHVDE